MSYTLSKHWKYKMLICTINNLQKIYILNIIRDKIDIIMNILFLISITAIYVFLKYNYLFPLTELFCLLLL